MEWGGTALTWGSPTPGQRFHLALGEDCPRREDSALSLGSGEIAYAGEGCLGTDQGGHQPPSEPREVFRRFPLNNPWVLPSLPAPIFHSLSPGPAARSASPRLLVTEQEVIPSGSSRPLGGQHPFSHSGVEQEFQERRLLRVLMEGPGGRMRIEGGS